MDKEKFGILMDEILNWGPTPFAPDCDQPMPFLFYNEMATLAGTALYDGYGKQEIVYILPTSFRLILYNKRKRGGDRCRSYWHHLDFGDWHWKDKNGFVISGIRTTPIGYLERSNKREIPRITWKTNFISPDGKEKLFEEVWLGLQQYHFHQKQTLVKWDKKITIPSHDKKQSQLAVVYYLTKLKLSSTDPGQLDLDALWLLHDDPFEANTTEVGYIDPESGLHPDNATRPTTRTGVSQVSTNTGKRTTSNKARETAKKAIRSHKQSKDVVETVQKAASLVKGGAGKLAKAGAKSSALRKSTKSKDALDKTVSEVKDELKGKVEEKLIDGAEQALDKKPRSAKTTRQKGKESRRTRKSANLQCPSCKQDIQPDWQFCPNCSLDLTSVCSSCNEVVEKDWKFCPYCTAEIKTGR